MGKPIYVTERTTGDDPNTGAERALRRPNRTKPIHVDDPSADELMRASEDSGALDFWDSPEEGDWQ